jgi:hypothetical protein
MFGTKQARFVQPLLLSAKWLKTVRNKSKTCQGTKSGVISAFDTRSTKGKS